MTKEEIHKILTKISSLYQNFQISPTTAELWLEIFGAFQYCDVSAAALEYFQSPAAYPPTPGQLMAKLREKAKTLVPTADDSWELVIKLARHVSALDMALVPPSIQRAMRGIGWDRVAYADVQKELPWIRKEFLANYEQEIENEITRNLELLLLRRNNVDALPSGDAKRAGAGRRDGEVLHKVFHALAETKAKSEAATVAEKESEVA